MPSTTCRHVVVGVAERWCLAAASMVEDEVHL
jgi:hypothetical protein